MQDQSVDELKTPKSKGSKGNVVQQYEKDRGTLKQHLYMVVVGHVDAGKSTLMGRLLCDLGQVSTRQFISKCNILTDEDTRNFKKVCYVTLNTKINIESNWT